jgi:hypothetical protein
MCGSDEHATEEQYMLILGTPHIMVSWAHRFNFM